ncbi:hypothetical protein GH714_032714 [Hevea brasiliensis]|uniref:Uncharacterized protein n=1 Tax=Hevea brasiliensis TaxID=3981 RepID=A0A6A6LPB6_HEVBR|nr:hypothetical protein GH714_032714 [Hevea brasiliensis]
MAVGQQPALIRLQTITAYNTSHLSATASQILEYTRQRSADIQKLQFTAYVGIRAGISDVADKVGHNQPIAQEQGLSQLQAMEQRFKVTNGNLQQADAIRMGDNECRRWRRGEQEYAHNPSAAQRNPAGVDQLLAMMNLIRKMVATLRLLELVVIRDKRLGKNMERIDKISGTLRIPFESLYPNF